MTKDGKGTPEQGALERVLSAYGGDPARWPVAQRAGLVALTETSDAARTMLAEARALDRVMDRAAFPVGTAPDALVAAIMAKATAAPQGAASNVVPLAPAARAPGPRVRPGAAQRGWRAPALMAASLAAGLLIGGGVNLVPALQDVAEAIGLSIDQGPASIVFNDTQSGFDEDVL